MMTSTIRKFGVGVASLALVAGVGAPAMAAPDGFDPSPFYNVENLRVAGADRVGTAIAYAKQAFTGRNAFGGKAGERVAYLAGDNSPADSATAGALGGPIFLAKADGSSNKDVAAAMNFLNVDTVVALGGEKAVPQEVLTAIAKAAGDANALRAGGEDRYATSVAIAERWSDINSQFTPGKVVLANGVTLVDALTAGTLKWPIMLVDEEGKLPQSVLDYLNKVKPLDYITVGGEKVVPEATVRNAQATSLKSDEVSTDDSLPILRGKAGRWDAMIEGKTWDGTSYRGFRVEAKAAADLAAKADEKATEVWNDVARAAKDLGAEVVEAYKESNEKNDALPGPAGKSWADYMISPETYNVANVVAKRNLLETAINNAYDVAGLDPIDLTKKGDVLSYLRITKNGVTVNKDALAKKYVDGAVESANKAADAYYRDNGQSKQNAQARLLSANKLGYLIMAEESIDTSKDIPGTNPAETYASKGINAFQVAGVAAHAKELTAGNLASAESTLRAINLKIAGVQDQVAGKSYWRIDGKDRFATAAGISARLNNLANRSMDAEKDARQVEKIYLVNGSAFADATVAGATYAPVLLIDANGTTMPQVTTNEVIRAAKDYRKNNHILEIWAVGGSKVVSNTALSNANATAVIAQQDLYQARGPVPQTPNKDKDKGKDETKVDTNYTAKSVKLKNNDTSGSVKTQVVVAGTETKVSPSKMSKVNVKFGTSSVDATVTTNGTVVAARDNYPGIELGANGVIDVKGSAAGTDAGTYTYLVTFEDGKTLSFKVEVTNTDFYGWKITNGDGSVTMVDGKSDASATLNMIGAAAPTAKFQFMKNGADATTGLADTDSSGNVEFVASESSTTVAKGAPAAAAITGGNNVTFTSKNVAANEFDGLQASGTFVYKLKADGKEVKLTVTVPALVEEATDITAIENGVYTSTIQTIQGLKTSDVKTATAGSESVWVVDEHGFKTGTLKNPALAEVTKDGNVTGLKVELDPAGYGTNSRIIVRLQDKDGKAQYAAYKVTTVNS